MAIIRSTCIGNHKFEARKQSIIFPEQCEEEGPITFEVRPDPELIIKSVLEHFPYLKFGNSFRGIDNYNFAFAQPWMELAMPYL